MLNQSEIDQTIKNMMRPEGTVIFSTDFSAIADKTRPAGIVFHILAGYHIFILERNDNLDLIFYHASPGTGTRSAMINLNDVSPSDTCAIALCWSPEILKLSIYSKSSDELKTAFGSISNIKFRNSRDNNIYRFDNQGYNTTDYMLYYEGKPLLELTALESWNEIVRAIEILSSGSSSNEMFEGTLSNLAIVMIITGFEVYTKRRFSELEGEGIPPNTQSLLENIIPTKEKQLGVCSLLETEAIAAGKTTLNYIISEKKINFQNFKKCKQAYNKAYGIKFGEIGYNSDQLTELQSYFQYRHRIVHISPTSIALNPDQPHSFELVMSSKNIMHRAIACFDGFVRLLHQATLNLRPSNNDHIDKNFSAMQEQSNLPPVKVVNVGFPEIFTEIS